MNVTCWVLKNTVGLIEQPFNRRQKKQKEQTGRSDPVKPISIAWL